jgi:quinol monooxygenase YgiN
MVAKTRVRPEKVELYESTFRDLKAKVLANEPGVSFYELCHDPVAPNAYQVIEAYENDAVQAHHLGTDYYLAASGVILSCLQGDHMEQIAKRGLTDPAEIYPLITSLTLEVLQPI